MSADLEVLITPDALQSLIHSAYVAGCVAVHANYQPDEDPDFTEAGYDYVASLDFTTTTRPARAEGVAPVSAKRSPADQDQQLVDQMRAAHARVWTEQGWRSEQSLRDGYEVWTLDSTGQRRIILARGCTPNVAALMCIVSTGLTRLCDIADAPVSAPLDREGVARIIDPYAWGEIDRRQSLHSDPAYRTNFEERMRRDGLEPVAWPVAWEITHARLSAQSLAKADAILALSQQDQVGLTTPAVLGEPSADALRSGGERS